MLINRAQSDSKYGPFSSQQSNTWSISLLTFSIVYCWYVTWLWSVCVCVWVCKVWKQMVTNDTVADTLTQKSNNFASGTNGLI